MSTIESATTVSAEKMCEYAAAWDALLRAKSVLLDSFERNLQAQHGLSITEYSVLLHLYEAEEKRMRMADLAEAVMISRSGLTRLVDRLQAHGLAERLACKQDRRSIWAQLTSAGIKRVEAVKPEYEKVVRHNLAEKLTRKEAQTVAKVLSKLIEETA